MNKNLTLVIQVSIVTIVAIFTIFKIVNSFNNYTPPKKTELFNYDTPGLSFGAEFTEEANMNETVNIGGLTLKVISISDYDGGQFPILREDSKLISVEVELTNLNLEPYSYGSHHNFMVLNEKGVSIMSVLISSMKKEPILSEEILKKGESIRGYVTFEIPVDFKETSLKYPTLSTKIDGEALINLEVVEQENEGVYDGIVSFLI